jgi:GrpB-like predicted nucleotidyltransferase (UPF0157 family)
VSEPTDSREPLADDEIARAAVGRPVRLDGPVELCESDPSWANMYFREETRIRRVLGAKALVVEHVGSTSVPGLAAKPIVDVVLSVADSSNEEPYVPALEAEGYVLTIREDDWFEHRMFKGPDTNVNLHVFSDGAIEVDRMVAFRDHLRVNTDDRRLYESVKRQLATQHWEFVQNYADAKSPVVEDIMRRALG